MLSWPVTCLVAFALAWSARAAAAEALYKRYTVHRDQATYNVIENEARNAKLEFVRNSGICETTPGVNSYSGYLSVGPDMNMFFWFFEARKNPDQAPLVAWFNGGPGASSMQGLFKSHGPCQFYEDDATEPSLNPHSYNELANIIYIDQPIGTGFSYGSACCNSTETAAVYVWEFLQVFHAAFPEFEGREFGIFAQSYGGRYAPVFASHILTQNAAIAAGTLPSSTTAVNLVALGLNDGVFNPAIWYRSMIDYSANNPYRVLANSSLVSELTAYYDAECAPRIAACYATDSNADCYGAMGPCQAIINKVTAANTAAGVLFSKNDVRQPADGLSPPETYAAYLYREDVQRAIGARKNYTLRALDVLVNVTGSGDWSRRSSTYIPSLLEAGVKVIIYAGDADWTCSYISNKREAESIEWPYQSDFVAKELEPYTVDGVEKGAIKTVGGLSYMRVYEAGHDLAYFQPALALQVMRQLFAGEFVST